MRRRCAVVLVGLGLAVASLLLGGAPLAGPARVGAVSVANPATWEQCTSDTGQCRSANARYQFLLRNSGDTSGCAFRLTVTWGDGTSQTVDVAGAPAAAPVLAWLPHNYARPGAYALTAWSIALTAGCHTSLDLPTFTFDGNWAAPVDFARGVFNQWVHSPTENHWIDSNLAWLPNPYSQDCINQALPSGVRAQLDTNSVGPFSVTGLAYGLASMRRVFDRVRVEQPALYSQLSTAGMLCYRNIRGSTTSISNHAWGAAVDIKVGGVLDTRGDGLGQLGLVILAGYFNDEGWYWGGRFPTEDAMHFEMSRELMANALAAGRLRAVTG